MAARVQIEIEARDAASGVLRAITSQFGALGQAGSDFFNMLGTSAAKTDLFNRALKDSSISVAEVARAEELAAAATARFYEQIALLVINGLKDAINETIKYADEVRSLAEISGQSTEATSRFLQVLDDYKISADDAMAATRVLTKQGLTPTIETLAGLSDKYLSLNNAQERTEFALKNLGRTGLQWVEVLGKGRAAILAQGAAVEAGLILSQKQVDAARANEIAVDNWNDSMLALKISVGNEALPVLTSFIDRQLDLVRAHELAKEAGKGYLDVLGLQREGFLDAAAAEREAADAAKIHSEAMKDETVATEEQIKAMEEAAQKTTDYYNNLISGIQSAQQETDRFNDTNAELNTQIGIQTAKIQQLITQGYSPAGRTIRDEQTKLDELNDKLDSNAKAHQKWAAQTIFAFAQARAAADGSISKGEGEVLIEIGEKLGLFDQQTAEAMEGVNAAFEDVDSSNVQSEIDAVNAALNALDGTTANTYINIITTQTGGGGGSGGCFIAGTFVTMADESETAIEDLIAGDVVLVYDFEAGANVPSPITKVFHHAKSETQSYLILNDRIGVTGVHRMFTARGWVWAEDLQLGDELRTQDGEFEKVASIEPVIESVEVFNIHVAHKDHNYYADNVLVHNAKTAAAGGPVYAGNAYTIGEAGSEVFVPQQSGRILGHAESLHAMTLGGGGGNTYYMYGPITLELSADAGNGLMGMR